MDPVGEISFNYLLKYVIVGDASVGKSNLLLRYSHGQFREEYQLTIGVEFGSNNVTINDKIFPEEQVLKVFQLGLKIVKILPQNQYLWF